MSDDFQNALDTYTAHGIDALANHITSVSKEKPHRAMALALHVSRQGAPAGSMAACDLKLLAIKFADRSDNFGEIYETYCEVLSDTGLWNPEETNSLSNRLMASIVSRVDAYVAMGKKPYDAVNALIAITDNGDLPETTRVGSHSTLQNLFLTQPLVHSVIMGYVKSALTLEIAAVPDLKGFTAGKTDDQYREEALRGYIATGIAGVRAVSNRLKDFDPRLEAYLPLDVVKSNLAKPEDSRPLLRLAVRLAEDLSHDFLYDRIRLTHEVVSRLKGSTDFDQGIQSMKTGIVDHVRRDIENNAVPENGVNTLLELGKSPLSQVRTMAAETLYNLAQEQVAVRVILKRAQVNLLHPNS